MSTSARWFERICGTVSEAAHRAWREPWPVARSSRAGLDIALLPSPLLRWSSRLLLLALLLHAATLLWLRHPWAALATAMLAAALAWLRHRRRPRPDVARRLLVTADGRMHLLMASGIVPAVRLHPGSVRLGYWVLLRLQAPQLRITLLLGPDNVEPPALAALRRRLN